MSKAKPIQALLGFRTATDAQVHSRATAVAAGMTGNTKFPNPPVDLNAMKSAIDTFAASIAEALDGSKKAMAARHQAREALIRILRQLATYVEAVSLDDLATFTTSGFEAKSSARATSQPLTQPVIMKVEQGSNSGDLVVRVTPLRKARSYDVRYALVTNGIPGQWITETATSARAGVTISGLTPPMTYAFQVRALGPLGYTDWSNSAMQICT